MRERSGKATGGWPGHPGKTLCQVETPDATVDHFPPACRHCGAALISAIATIRSRLDGIVCGYLGHHAVPTNSPALNVFRHHLIGIWRRALRQRSRKDHSRG